MRKYILIVVLAAMVLGIAYGFMLYFKPHRNIAKERPAYEMSANELLSAFSTNKREAFQKFNEQVVEFHGKLGEVTVNGDSVYYAIVKGSSGLLNCELDNDAYKSIQNKQQNKEVTLKGLFVGYDELLGEIQFKKCTLIQ